MQEPGNKVSVHTSQRRPSDEMYNYSTFYLQCMSSEIFKRHCPKKHFHNYKLADISKKLPTRNLFSLELFLITYWSALLSVFPEHCFSINLPQFQFWWNHLGVQKTSVTPILQTTAQLLPPRILSDLICPG